MLPAQNATGNWVKVVQRVPIRLSVQMPADAPPLRTGMSATVEIDTGHRRHLGDLSSGAVRGCVSGPPTSGRLMSAAEARVRKTCHDDRASEPRWLLTVCIMLATIMQALDTTIANVALPYMQGTLSATAGPDQLGADLLYRRGRHRDAGHRLARGAASAASGCS